VFVIPEGQKEMDYIDTLRKNNEPEYIKCVLRVRHEASASVQGKKRTMEEP
jgi:hypothetical protein